MTLYRGFGENYSLRIVRKLSRFRTANRLFAHLKTSPTNQATEQGAP